MQNELKIGQDIRWNVHGLYTHHCSDTVCVWSEDDRKIIFLEHWEYEHD